MVTGYQIGKWSRGVLLIISGIFMISVLNEFQINIRMAPSFVRDTATIEFITMLIYYSIVSSFVYAAVSIAAGFISKNKGMSLSTLNKRVNALDKNLYMMNWPTSSAGMMSATPAMMGAMPVEKASKKGKMAVIAVVAILIIAAVAIGLVMFAFNGSPEPGAASSEQAFNTFLDRMNAGDAQGAIGKTVFTFASNSSDYVDMLDQMLSSSSIHMTLISGPTVYNEQMLDPTEKANVSARVAEIESTYGIDVTEFTVIAFKISVSTPDGQQTISERMPCVLVEGKWYLDVKELFSNRGDNGNGDGNGNGNPKIQVFLNNNFMPDGNWYLTVSGLNNTQLLPDSDVYLDILNGSDNGQMFSRQLSSMMTNVFYSGVMFNDGASAGEIDQGDEFIIDGGAYPSGSKFVLRDPSDSVTYAEVIL